MSKKKDESVEAVEEPRYDPNPAFSADSVVVSPFEVSTPVGNPVDEPSVSLLASQWENVEVQPGSEAETIKESVMAEALLAVEEPAAEPVEDVEPPADPSDPADPETPAAEEPLEEPAEVPAEDVPQE